MAGLRVHFVFPAVLVERVDAVRGELSRGEFVRRAVEQALEGRPGASVSPGVQLPAAAPAEQPESDYVCPQCGPAPEGPDEHAERFHTWSPTSEPPYRQHVPGPNVEQVRSSAQVKGDIRPIPKRKP